MKWIAAGPGGCSCLCVKRLQSTSHSTALLCIQSCWFGHRHIIQNVPSEPGLAWDNWIKILLLDNRVCHSQTRISFLFPVLPEIQLCCSHAGGPPPGLRRQSEADQEPSCGRCEITRYPLHPRAHLSPGASLLCHGLESDCRLPIGFQPS